MSLSSAPRSALQELPVEQFLDPPNPSLTVTPSKHNTRAHKRPRSPAAPSSCSPVKRRILCEDSIVSPTFKSPFSSTKSGRISPTRFHDLLMQDPDSPIKKLDFGQRDENVESMFPSGMTVSVLSRRSPRTSPQLRSKATASGKKKRSLALRSPVWHTPDSSPVGGIKDGQRNPALIVTSSPQPSPPITIPRRVTPPSRNSIHYPGFDVYLDPHDYVPKAPNTTSMGGIEYHMDYTVNKTSAKEADKENISPRRRSQKLVFGGVLEASLPEASPEPSKSSKGNQNVPMPGSPRNRRVYELSGMSGLTMPFSLPSSQSMSWQNDAFANFFGEPMEEM
ncbi:hypothetical protein QCA50_000421 [Cerrena zonata]|uniref:Uncharacterized protein n=1 Tax=Cerrena zonata TaxID=2478898 RepID=A0AAW0GZZ8_9APHY